MKEIRDIIKAYDEAQQLGMQTALATVVHVQGSSYRRPGARMLIREDGQLTGAISGGCLEGDALRKALLVIQEGNSKLVTYDSMDDDEAIFGMSLGCNGIIQVLIEPIRETAARNPIVFLKALDEQRQRSVLLTLFHLSHKRATQYGTCMLLQEDGTIINQLPAFAEILLPELAQTLQLQQSGFKQFVFGSESITCFFEVIQPAIRLVIAGAGNDVVPLANLAEILGWEVLIADGRPAYASPQRFAGSCQVVVAKPAEFLQHIRHDAYTFYLLMTHNYQYDKAVLQQLLQQQVFYIGMLGPKKKKERMLQEWQAEGILFSPVQLAALHSPAGLDIGGETPEEIALSIVAEIKTVVSLRTAASLRNLPGAIHDRQGPATETIVIHQKN